MTQLVKGGYYKVAHSDGAVFTAFRLDTGWFVASICCDLLLQNYDVCFILEGPLSEKELVFDTLKEITEKNHGSS